MSFDCSICMTPLVYGQVIVATRCGHVYHKPCVDQWTERAKSCPQCRRTIVPGKCIPIYPSEGNVRHMNEKATSLLNSVAEAKVFANSTKQLLTLTQTVSAMSKVSISSARERMRSSSRQSDRVLRGLQSTVDDMEALVSALEQSNAKTLAHFQHIEAQLDDLRKCIEEMIDSNSH